MSIFSEFITVKRGIVIFALSLTICSILHAQSNKFTFQNIEELIRFSKQKNVQWNLNKRKADSLANVLNIPIYYQEKDSNKVVILQSLGPKNKPVYYATDNISAAATISVDKVWSATNEYPSLTGAGTEINLWDGGTVRATHQELQNGPGTRIIMRDLELPLSNHSTHIAGTMIASGVNPDAKGMAGKSIIKAWDLNDDIAEMSGAAADGILVSNHSYGPLCGWYYNSTIESWYWYGDPTISATEDYEFGFYNQTSADLDFIAELAPNYLIVKSAGNDRSDTPESSFLHYVWDENWVLVNTEREPDGGTDGFDCLTPLAVAKNILTVGAVDDARAMTTFSSFGPTDDGRIKPDVVANGFNVLSSTSTSDNSYTSYNGTSMSTASATGSAALLLQLQNTLQPGVQLRSSTIKGLLIHTASDLGNSGPDYRFGWGLLNIKEAANLIYTNSNNQGKNIYEEVLSNGEEITIPVSTSAFYPFLKITLSWIDPPGQPSSPSLNPRTSKLVNDLDVSVVNTNNLQNYFPWLLNFENPDASALKNINHVDNVEQVYIANPGDNNFNVIISHSGTISGGSQAFSLIITGIETTPNVFPPQNLTYTINESSIHLNWNQPEIGTPISYKIYRNKTLLKETSDLFYIDQTIVFNNLYEYYVTAVYNLNNEKTESLGTNVISVYPQTLRALPFFVDFESEIDDIQFKNNLTGWLLGNSESLNCYYLDFSDNTSKFIGADSYSAGEAVHVSDIAYTAPLRLADYSNIVLSFDYLLKTGIYDAIDELHVVYKLQEELEWHELKKLDKAFNWIHHSFQLPVEICKNSTQIGFYYDDFYQWGMGAGLDNINITGESTRSVDFTINSMTSPITSCILSNNEFVSLEIKNVGTMSALPGTIINIQMQVTDGTNITDQLVLNDSLLINEVITFQMSKNIDLSKKGNYTFEFKISSTFDLNLSNNTFINVVEVFGEPISQILNSDLTFCENDQPVLLQVDPTGGTLSGVGISGQYFNPATAGVGTYTITYSVTDINGCTGTVSKEFTVTASPQPEIRNVDLIFCENDQPVLLQVDPTGGTLSGVGISGQYFSPATAGVGTYTITYSVTGINGCTGTVSKEFTVTASPQPEILNSNLVFCENSEPVLIEVSPTGGTLSGDCVTDFCINPSLIGAGSYWLTYSVFNEMGCEESIIKEVTILKNAEINLGPDLIVDINDTIILEPVGDAFSFIWFDGTTNDKKTIIAKDFGLGNFNIWLIALNDNQCSSIDSLLLKIDFSSNSTEKINFPGASIYPNPFREGFYLTLNENEIIEKIDLYSLDGHIYSNSKPDGFQYFNFSDLSSGTYLLHIVTRSQNVVLKIVKM